MEEIKQIEEEKVIIESEKVEEEVARDVSQPVTISDETVVPMVEKAMKFQVYDFPSDPADDDNVCISCQ